jgi:polysaccharide deacetylase 2 family uncharacterized protein YibQ
MTGFVSKLVEAGRTSVSLRRLCLALVCVGAGATLVALARGTPWGAPWAAAGSATASSGRAPGTSFERIDRALNRVLDEGGIDRAAVKSRIVPVKTEQDSFARAELDLPVPQGTSFVQMNAGIARAAQEAGVAVLDVVELRGRPGGSGLEITLGMGERETHRLKLERETFPPPPANEKPGKPRIALVFDDLGGSMNGVSRDLLNLDARVTFGVIAGLKHSNAFAESARAHGHDVILNIPMEPYDRTDHDPGRNAILHDLDEMENLRRLHAHLSGLARYSGVSNHMGSRVTSDPALMAVILEAVREHDRSLFFLDSRTTPFSVAGQQGRRAGVSILVNNLFLDGPSGVDVDVGAQIARLEEIARRRGRAIAIGHLNEETVAAVREAIDRWRTEGIAMVTLSEMAAKERPGKRPAS